MDGGFGVLILLGFVAFMSRIVDAARRRTSGTTTGTELPPPDRLARPVPARRAPTTLEELRAEMLGELEKAREMHEAETTTRSLPAPAPKPAKVKTPVRNSAPVPAVKRPAPPVELATYDRDAELVIRQRREIAEQNNASLDERSHRTFHKKIETPPPRDAAPVRRVFTAKQAREAMIWREILEPPLALREERDR